MSDDSDDGGTSASLARAIGTAQLAPSAMLTGAGAPSPLEGTAALRAATERLVALARARTDIGEVVRLDGKAGCDAGPFGNDYARLRDNAFDPAWCTRDRDRIQPPVLRLEVSCADLGTLFWPDVYQAAQRALSAALMSKPSARDPWALRMQWTRDVMTLVSVALEATNISPIFAWPSAWGTVTPKMAFNDDGEIEPFGEYTSGFTFDGRALRPRPDGSTSTVAGGCTPRALHGFALHSYEQTLRELRSPVLPAFRESRDRFRREFGVPGTWGELETQDVRIRPVKVNGVHFARESVGFESLTAGPAMMVGSCFTTASPTVKALKGEHDPWTTVGFEANGDGPLVLPVAMIARAGVDGRKMIASLSDDCTWPCTTDWEALGRVRKTYAGKSLEGYMRALFMSTQGQPAGLVRGYTNGDWGNAGMTSATRDRLRAAVGGASDDQIRLNMRVPNSQWFLEAAAQWAGVIASLPFETYVTNSTTYYLVNHYAYFALKTPGMVGMSAAEAAELAEGMRQLRTQIATMGSQIGAQLVGQMNQTAGQIAGELSAGISDEMSRYAHFPEYPKSLYRRVTSAQNCGGTGVGTVGGGMLPWFVAAGGVVAGASLAYLLRK